MLGRHRGGLPSRSGRGPRPTHRARPGEAGEAAAAERPTARRAGAARGAAPVASADLETIAPWPRRAPGHAAAAGARDPDHPRRVGQAGAGQRLREDHAGPRPQRLRGLEAPRGRDRDHQHPQPDGTLNENAGPYAGQDRFDARKQVVADALEAPGLLEAVEDREIEIGHSDRSKTIVEPYLSKQWFVRMGDRRGRRASGRGTPGVHHQPGLAQAAIDAADGGVAVGHRARVCVPPRPERYRRTYTNWLAEKRDWCISRQLWWGHQIPGVEGPRRRASCSSPLHDAARPWPRRCLRVGRAARRALTLNATRGRSRPCGDRPTGRSRDTAVRDPAATEEQIKHRCWRASGLERDPDVLDTWFSSALWPHSTLGWPDPRHAPSATGQSPLASADGDAPVTRCRTTTPAPAW